MTIQQMIAESGSTFDKHLAESRAEFAEVMRKMEINRIQHEKALLEIMNRFEKNTHDMMYKTIRILGAIVVITGAVASLIHHFI